MNKTIMIALALALVMSVGMVSAQHTPNATLTPLWSPASTNVDYTVEMCNQAGPDGIWRVELVKNNLYTNFDCADLAGWSKSVISFYDPELGAVTEMCQYNSLDPNNNLEPGECKEFDFSATTPVNENCNLLWKFRTTDEESQYGGVWETVRNETGVDSTKPEFVKTVTGPQALNGDINTACPNGPADSEYCHVTDATVIEVNVTDPGAEQCGENEVIPSGLDHCDVQVLVDGSVDSNYSMTIYDNDNNDLDDSDNDITFDVQFAENTEHQLQFTCYDVAGNKVQDSEDFRVDMEAPKTTIDLQAGQEYYTNGTSNWLDTNSAISLSVTDEPTEKGGICAIGTEETFYQDHYFPQDTTYTFGDSQFSAWDFCRDACDDFPASSYKDEGWLTYEGGDINPGDESCHVIEYYSVDKFGHKENVQHECYFVDKTPPEMTKVVGAPKVPLADYSLEGRTTPLTQDELDNNWTADRTFPTGGVTSVAFDGRNDVADIGIISDDVSTASGTFYRTEGIQTKNLQDFGDAVQVDLYVDSDWADKAVRAGFWVAGYDNADALQSYGIIEFTNVEELSSGDSPYTYNFNGWRVWDNSGYWTDVNMSFSYDQWYTLEIVLDAANQQFLYYINGKLIGTGTAPSSEYIGKLWLNQYNYGLDTFPTLSTENYDAHWSNVGMVKDWYVKTSTDIDLSCVDPEPHPSGNEVIHWTTYRSEDGETWTEEDSDDYQGQHTTVNFEQTSLHKLEWYCTDAVHKTSETDVEYFKVDDEPPVITKDVEGVYSGDCPPDNGNMTAECYLKGTDANVTVSVADTQAIHMVDDVTCDYSVEWNNGVLKSGSFGEEGMVFSWDEDSEHILSINCSDALGNEATDVERFLVDILPPVTTKTYGLPSVVDDGYRWITSATPINFTAEDAKVGVKNITYRVTNVGDDKCVETCRYKGSGDWTTVEDNKTTFTIPDESCHYIEFFATDKFGNEETLNSQCVMVDNSAPNMTKVIGEPHVIKDGKDYITQDTPISLVCNDVMPHPVGRETFEFRYRTAKTCDELGEMTGEDGGWTAWQTPDGDFRFPEDSCHELEYRCVDGLGNAADIESEIDVVDSQAPVITAEVKGPEATCLPKAESCVGWDCLAQDHKDFEATVRFGQLNTPTNGGWELAIKEPDASQEVDGQYGWTSGQEVPFELSYDSDTGDVVLTVGEGEAAKSISYTYDAQKAFEYIDIVAKGKTAGALHTTVSDVMVNGLAMPDVVATDDYQGAKLFLPDTLQQDGFVMTGMVTLSWETAPTSSGAEIPGFQVFAMNTHDLTDECIVMDGVSTVLVQAYDPDPHPVGDVTCDWSYMWNNELYGPYSEDDSFEIAGWNESKHDLHVNCSDALGNEETFDHTYYVDKTPPFIWKDYELLYSNVFDEGNDSYWAKFTAVGKTISAGVDDVGPHLSGIQEVKYKVTQVADDLCKYPQQPESYMTGCDEASEGGEWTTVSPQNYDEFEFSIGEESCHMIEIMAEDNVNKCALHKQFVYVDDTAPNTAKVIAEPKSKMENGTIELGHIYYPNLTQSFCDESEENCMDVTLLTNIDLACEDPAPHPSGATAIYFMVSVDGDDVTPEYCERAEGSLTEDGYCYLEDGTNSFHFSEETWHKLTYYCEDNVGNVGVPDTEYFKVEGTAFDIELNKKWNLISVPVKLQDNSMGAVFDEQPGVSAVWTYDGSDWFVYTPDGVDNDNLDTMLPGWGYWVLTTEPSTLTIGGSLLSPQVTPPDKEIVHGWNLVGYYGVENAPLEDGVPAYMGPNLYGDGRVAWCNLATLRDNLWDMNTPSLWTYWEVDNPDQWKDLGYVNYMNPGAGYWLFFSGEQGGIYAPSTTCSALENNIPPPQLG